MVAVPPEAEVVLEEEVLGEVPEEDQTLFSNLIVILVSSLLKAKNIFLSPKTSYLANQYMARSASLSKVLMVSKLNTGYGILSAASWRLEF